MRVGDHVRLVTPENSQLDGSMATIMQLTEWGAHCNAPAAATGQFRALWSEMELVSWAPHVSALAGETTGDFCDNCGSARMMRSGTCKTCMDCGSTGGCG